jgi:hypothetical protein
VPGPQTADAAARLLSGLPIADITIQEEPIEAVIEKVFAVPGSDHSYDNSAGNSSDTATESAEKSILEGQP